MLEKMSSVLLLGVVMASVFSSLAMTQDQKQVEVDPLLVDDLKGERTSSLKLVEVEFRIVLLDTNRIRDDDMNSIRGLFDIAKGNQPAAAVGYPNAGQPGFRPLFAGGMLGNVSAKLRAGSAEGPIKHQVLETEPFQALLTWMSAKNVAHITNTSSRRIALGSTAVVLDQRVSLPRLAKKKDARTGSEIHTINFVHTGLHLELTPLAQTFPKTKEQAEVWQLRLDRVMSTLTAGDEPESKLDRVQHTVTLGVGQTALIPQLVESDQPAFILLSVKAPKPSTGMGMGMMSSMMDPAAEIIRLSKDPNGPGLADRITQTLVPPQGTPKPSLFKLDDTGPARTPASRIIVEAVAGPNSAKNLGVVQRVIKESEIPRRDGVWVLELQENEIVEVVLSDKVSNVHTGGDQKSLLMARPLEPTSLAIQAGRKGVGTVEFEAGKDTAGRTARFHFEVIVRGDTRLLGRTLDTLFPDDKVELTEVDGAIVIRGKVSRSAVAKQIVEIAEQYYGKVLDQTESRDSNQLLPADGSDAPKVVPAIGTEIRDLRTDVRSLRNEIQKLIKVLENKSELKEEASLPEATRVRLGDDPLPRVKFRQPVPRR